MRLAAPGAPHLTYCTNIHAGDAWSEVRANVADHVTAVKARVGKVQEFLQRPYGPPIERPKAGKKKAGIGRGGKFAAKKR